MVTGWLLAFDALVTAGHCMHNGILALVYQNLDRIQWQGLVTTDGLFSCGAMAVTLAGPIASEKNIFNDFAAVRLNQPLIGTTNTNAYNGTPLERLETLGVVGYPSDKELDEEYGAQIYEEYNSVD
jgi:V8-like Glu-specific endopeptidase